MAAISDRGHAFVLRPGATLPTAIEFAPVTIPTTGETPHPAFDRSSAGN